MLHAPCFILPWSHSKFVGRHYQRCSLSTHGLWHRSDPWRVPLVTLSETLCRITLVLTFVQPTSFIHSSHPDALRTTHDCVPAKTSWPTLASASLAVIRPWPLSVSTLYPLPLATSSPFLRPSCPRVEASRERHLSNSRQPVRSRDGGGLLLLRPSARAYPKKKPTSGCLALTSDAMSQPLVLVSAATSAQYGLWCCLRCFPFVPGYAHDRKQAPKTRFSKPATWFEGIGCST
ncbi:hypothetical protein V8C37DRAFT_372532 [Trichoderma ceciliae]